MIHWAWATTGNHVASVKVNIVCQRQPPLASKVRCAWSLPTAKTRRAHLDEFIAGDDWRFHDVLSQAVPETNGRRADHAFSAKPESEKHQASPVSASAM
jgi:hypothetical protein